MNQRERDFAVMEGERINAAQEYFEARPFLQSQHSDRVFDAGFERGWKAAQAQQPAQATTAQEPTVDEAIDQLVGALKRSKGWLGDYADAIIRDAIDRKHLGDETAQEPVAEWVKRPGLEDYPVLEFKEGYECEIGHKLFLHPAPQRKPLTPMQLAEIENRHNWQTTAGRFAIYREIEATKGQT